jgi:hypothetical protein
MLGESLVKRPHTGDFATRIGLRISPLNEYRLTHFFRYTITTIAPRGGEPGKF